CRLAQSGPIVFERPIRQEHVGRSAGASIRVNIYGNGLPASSRFIEQVQSLQNSVPLTRAGTLEVRYLSGDLRLSSNFKSLANRFNSLGAFIANVRGIQSAITSCNLSQGDDLGRFREAPGHIFKSSRKSDRPIFHRPVNQVSHRIQFLRGWLARDHSHDFLTYTVVTDKCGYVDITAILFQTAKQSSDVCTGSSTVA